METLLKLIFDYGPLVFGVLFIAPLTAQILERAGWDTALGVNALVIGVIFGTAWGAYAQSKGSWL